MIYNVSDKTLKDLNLKDSLPVDTVNITNKKRGNLFAWRGQFSPQLIEALIENYGRINDTVYDPFAGSGTVLLEASRHGLNSYGTELNPAAWGLASIYTLMPTSSEMRENALRVIDQVVQDYYFGNNLFRLSEAKPLAELKPRLVSLLREHGNNSVGIITNALIIGLDFEQKILTTQRLESSWSKLKDKIRSLPVANVKIELSLGDARQTNIPKSSIDLVITSPPYINVFNYHQNYRRSVEATGFDVLEVARSEIGSNRKFRSNRFLTVVQYAIDIFMVFRELQAVCKETSKIIFIVGRESSVRKTPFYNAILLAEVAQSMGFVKCGEQTRCFSNKFGQSIYEEILRFSMGKTEDHECSIEQARTIAIQHLQEARKYAPEDSMTDLEDAIRKADSVSPSPIFNHTR